MAHALLYCIILVSFALRASAAIATVTSFVGGGADGTSFGEADGVGTTAGFYYVFSVAPNSFTGNLVAADSGNHRIRTITPVGVVTTLAGGGADGMTSGFADGAGSSAGFYSPYCAVVDSSSAVIVADSSNAKIRVISALGVVTTLAGGNTSGFNRGFADGVGSNALFDNPTSLAVYASIVYVADSVNGRVRAITPAGLVTTLAGGTRGQADGVGTFARFAAPQGIANDAAGVLYVTDSKNHNVRAISRTGLVSTIAGGGESLNSSGTVDGVGTAALFFGPFGLVIDSSGIMYIADAGNNKVRAIARGVVTTIAGGGDDGMSAGFADGDGTSATFQSPSALSLGAARTIFVADRDNHKVRVISMPPAPAAPPPASDVPLISGGAGAAALVSLVALAVCVRARLRRMRPSESDTGDPGAGPPDDLTIVPNPLFGAADGSADVGDPTAALDGPEDGVKMSFGQLAEETPAASDAAAGKLVFAWESGRVAV